MSSRKEQAIKTGEFIVDNAEEIRMLTEIVIDLHKHIRKDGKKAGRVSNIDEAEKAATEIEKNDEEAIEDTQKAEEDVDEALQSLDNLIGILGEEVSEADQELANLKSMLQKVSGKQLTEQQAEKLVELSKKILNHIHEEIGIDKIVIDAFYRITGATEKLAEAEAMEVSDEKAEKAFVDKIAGKRHGEREKVLEERESVDIQKMKEAVSHLRKEEGHEHEEAERLEDYEKEILDQLRELSRLLDSLLTDWLRENAQHNPKIKELVTILEKAESALDTERDHLSEIESELNAAKTNISQSESATP